MSAQKCLLSKEKGRLRDTLLLPDKEFIVMAESDIMGIFFCKFSFHL